MDWRKDGTMDTVELTEPEYKSYHCRCCHAQLALTDGRQLLFGQGAYATEPIPLVCGHCGLRQIWKPVKVLDVIAIDLYTERQPA